MQPMSSRLSTSGSPTTIPTAEVLSPTGPSESFLVREARTGDTQAYGELVQRYGTRRMHAIRGAARAVPVGGPVFLLGAFAIAGLPPSASLSASLGSSWPASALARTRSGSPCWRCGRSSSPASAPTSSRWRSADRPGRWLGSITTPGADLERLRRRAAGTQAAAGHAPPPCVDPTQAAPCAPGERPR